MERLLQGFALTADTVRRPVLTGLDLIPTYNLKAVVKETGIKPDTLRAWERRYGLPEPERTAGGHRLFSRRDVDTIKWLMSREGEGLSISRAVELWRRLVAEGRDPLQMDKPDNQLSGPSAISPIPQHAGEIQALRQAWVEACLSFDENRAGQVLSQAFALYTPEVVVLELLRKGVVEAGEGWCRGAQAVEQEYFASELARQRLEALMVAMPPATRSGRILSAAAPGEVNTLHALILAFLLRRRGFDALFLGNNVTVPHVQATVSRLQPNIVVLFAHRITSAANLLDLVEVLHPLNVPAGYMGAVFNMLPALRDRIPGHFLGEELEEAVVTLEELLSLPSQPMTLPAPVEAYQHSVFRFREAQASIEADVWRLMNLDSGQYDQLSAANERLGDVIVAALRLGNIRLLGTQLEWLQCLLDYQCFDPDLLRQYVAAYHEAAESRLDNRAAMVTDWLSDLAGL